MSRVEDMSVFKASIDITCKRSSSKTVSPNILNEILSRKSTASDTVLVFIEEPLIRTHEESMVQEKGSAVDYKTRKKAWCKGSEGTYQHDWIVQCVHCGARTFPCHEAADSE